MENPGISILILAGNPAYCHHTNYPYIPVHIYNYEIFVNYLNGYQKESRKHLYMLCDMCWYSYCSYTKNTTGWVKIKHNNWPCNVELKTVQSMQKPKLSIYSFSLTKYCIIIIIMMDGVCRIGTLQDFWYHCRWMKYCYSICIMKLNKSWDYYDPEFFKGQYYNQ